MARGAPVGGNGGGAPIGDVTGDLNEPLSSTLDSRSVAFSASLCEAVGAISVS